MENDLRKIPELEFYLDETLDYVENINNLLKDLNIKKENEE
jgi:ribosome-binding factor A